MEMSLDLIARGLEEAVEHIRDGLTFRRCFGIGLQLDVVLHGCLQKFDLVVADSHENYDDVHGDAIHKIREVLPVGLPYVLITSEC